MPGFGSVELASGCKPFEAVLADRLEHMETSIPRRRLDSSDEALVNQRGQTFNNVNVTVSTHHLGRFQRKAAAKDGQMSEQPLLLRGQQLVAPRDRRVQRFMTCWCV